jgi:single-strand DNA-binding protein
MSGVNKVILVGRLGKDPEIRTFDNGGKIASFSMATSEKYKDKNTGQQVENTEWHNVIVNKSLADIVEKWVKKGDQIFIEGKLKTRSWEKDGVVRYTTEIQGYNIQMLGGNNTAPATYGQTASEVNNQVGDGDDLPF